jgi:type I restriction enzyme R subunit
VLWFHDVRHPLNQSRRIAAFHTPAALQELLARDFDAACAWLAATPNVHPMLRPYQVEANTAIELAIAARKRQMLVAMATGTGKTFTMVNQVYRLLKSRVARRILFLVDRRALAARRSMPSPRAKAYMPVIVKWACAFCSPCRATSLCHTAP